MCVGLFDWLKAIFGRKKRTKSTTVVIQVSENRTEQIIPEIYLAELIGKSKKEKEFYQALFSQLISVGWADPSVAPVPERSKYRWLKRLYTLKVVEKTPSGHIVFSDSFIRILDQIKTSVELSKRALEKGNIHQN